MSYRGEIFVVFRPIIDNFTMPEIGKVIAQCHVTHHPQIVFNEVNKLEDLGITDRGNGGFGSTEKN